MEGRASDWRPGPTVCRCCLTEGCYKDISTEYFWMGKREVYAEMLSETLNVSIAFSKSGGPNSNSRLICEPCIARLRDASEFKRQVVDCEKTFMHHLDPGSSSRAREFNVETAGEVKVEVVKREKASLSDDDFDDRPDFLDVDTDDDLDDQPLTKLASKIPKKESVDLLDLLDSSQITVKRKSNLKLKEAPPKKIIKKKEVVKPSVSKTTPVKQAENKKGIDDPDETQADVVTRHDKKAQAILAKRDRLQRVLVLLECSRICLFKRKASSFICIYCDQGYVDPAKLREHNIEHEDVKPVDIKKAIARIDKPELLKADITDVSCKLCNTSIHRLDDLVKHLFEKHNKKIDLNAEIGILPYKMNLDDYICAICGEKFTDYKTLNHHMNLHYPRFVCEQCGSGFVTAMRLKSHVVTHETGSFPCNACDKVFNSKDAMKGHFAYLHMKVKKHSCPQCHEKFSNYFQRLKHLSSVHGMDLDEYKCNFCTRVFNAKGPLRSHIRASHLKEKSHACDECDATFFSKSCLRKHVVKHSGEKKHQCCVCLKAFGRKSTLVQHMRIHLNDRRFVCNVCEASFVQKCSLKQHGRTHHPNNPNPADQYD